MSSRTLSAVVVLSLVILAGCPATPEDTEPATGAPMVAAPKPAVAPPETALVASAEPAPSSESSQAETIVPPTPPPPIAAEAKPQPAVEVARKVAEAPAPAPTPAPAQTPPPAPTPAPAATPPPKDPLQRMQEQQQARAEQAVALNKAREDMVAAQAELQTLETRLLQTRNPFGPRPDSGLPPDEAKEWTKLDGAERVKRVEEQIAAARSKADATRNAYLALGGRLD